ncbi:hypothetical protein BB561_004353 [Smittium simulii]|uniref:ADF-H domain-containing protein n=1 Tax=Smittium simulii TaxID=133385 RepID=A0A2T9YGX9_9FUNG|nr:hypothetical protein BB561_004353 [Smittium simulii]
MSSVTSGIKAGVELETALASAKLGDIISLEILNDTISVTKLPHSFTNSSSNKISDFFHYNQPSYILINQAAESWTLITWIPEAKVNIKLRMLYASTQDEIKRKIGFANLKNSFQMSDINDALAFFNIKDLTQSEKKNYDPLNSFTQNSTVAPITSNSLKQFNSFEKVLNPRLAMSEFELAKLSVLESEDLARQESIDHVSSNLKRVNKNSCKNSDIYSNVSATAAKTGGFHHLMLPIDQDCLSKLGTFAKSSLYFIAELQVSNNTLFLLNSFTDANGADSKSKIIFSLDPKYFFVKINNSQSLFIVYIPDSSPLKSRMIYSSSLISVLDQLDSINLYATHKAQVFEKSEISISYAEKLIADGTAKSRETDKPIDQVLNFRPAVPAKSVPTRFSINSKTATNVMPSELVSNFVADFTVLNQKNIPNTHKQSLKPVFSHNTSPGLFTFNTPSPSTNSSQPLNSNLQHGATLVEQNSFLEPQIGKLPIKKFISYNLDSTKADINQKKFSLQDINNPHTQNINSNTPAESDTINFKNIASQKKIFESQVNTNTDHSLVSENTLQPHINSAQYTSNNSNLQQKQDRDLLALTNKTVLEPHLPQTSEGKNFGFKKVFPSSTNSFTGNNSTTFNKNLTSDSNNDLVNVIPKPPRKK